MKNLKKLGSILLVIAMTACLAGCGAPVAANNAAPAEAEAIYIYGEPVPNDMNDEDYDLYQLKLFGNGSYELVKTSAAHGYDQLLGSTIVIMTGTYKNEAAADGLIPCSLTADRVIYNSYSDMGGYNITIDTKDAVYPVELPGNKMTEENEFKQIYGDMTVYLIQDTNAFSLTAE